MARTSSHGLPDMGSRRHLSIIDDIEGRIAGELSAQNLSPDDPRAAALLMGYLVDALPEPMRSAVQMMAQGIPYSEAAALLEPELGRPVNKGQVWRWAKYGIDQMREWLGGTPWVAVLVPLAGSLPPVDDDHAADQHTNIEEGQQ